MPTPTVVPAASHAKSCQERVAVARGVPDFLAGSHGQREGAGEQRALPRFVEE